MALGATIYKVEIELSDVDRGVYESIALRLAQHPSEDEARVVLRLLALALLYEEGLSFGKGLSSAEEPALSVHGPGDSLLLWVDVGKPAAARLHKASKKADRVAVLSDEDPERLKLAWQNDRVHRAESLELLLLPHSLVKTLADGLSRTLHWGLTLVDGQLSVAQGESLHSAELRRLSLADLLS